MPRPRLSSISISMYDSSSSRLWRSHLALAKNRGRRFTLSPGGESGRSRAPPGPSARYARPIVSARLESAGNIGRAGYSPSCPKTRRSSFGPPDDAEPDRATRVQSARRLQNHAQSRARWCGREQDRALKSGESACPTFPGAVSPHTKARRGDVLSCSTDHRLASHSPLPIAHRGSSTHRGLRPACVGIS
jgi:hypothetical protein